MLTGYELNPSRQKIEGNLAKTGSEALKHFIHHEEECCMKFLCFAYRGQAHL
jgi:hypothetical protein